MQRCAFTKADGSPCRGTATGGAAYCYAHDPDRAEERKANARRGGKAGGNGRPGTGELADLKARILATVEGVLDGTVDRGRAAVAVQGYNALRAALELERKIRETEELAQRIEALEQADTETGGRTWR
jgi:hypothetical protein